jgi:hypothetical protein
MPTGTIPGQQQGSLKVANERRRNPTTAMELKFSLTNN